MGDNTRRLQGGHQATIISIRQIVGTSELGHTGAMLAYSLLGNQSASRMCTD